jgi:acetyl-CoA C-acetyltransferase
MLQDGNGTVTAGNSSTYGDAAAAVVLMGSDIVKSRGITPIARVVAFAQVGVDPAYMGMGPVPAITSVVSLPIYRDKFLNFFVMLLCM